MEEMLTPYHSLQFSEKRLEPGGGQSLLDPGNQDWSFLALIKVFFWATSLSEEVILYLSSHMFDFYNQWKEDLPRFWEVACICDMNVPINCSV